MHRRIRPYASLASLTPFSVAAFSNAKGVSGVTRANDDYRHYVDGPVTSGVFGAGATRAFSMSFWVKQVTAPINYRGLASTSTSFAQLNDGFAFYWVSATQLRFFVGNYATAAKISNVAGLSPVGNWLFVVGTYDADNPDADNRTLHAYVDAVSGTDAGTDTSDVTASGNKLQLFKITAGAQADIYYNDAVIDEVALWDTKLSQADVTRLYNSGTPTDLSQDSKAANLKMWWRCGDHPSDSPPTIHDAAGNGHDGTQSGVTGTATIVEDAPP